LFIIAGIVLFIVVFPDAFGGHSHEGLDANRIIIAGVIGAISAVVGAGVGFLIEKLRR
jgi:hypothetical protein